MAMLNNQMAICSPKKFNEIPIFADNHRVATGLGVDGPNLRALKWRASVVLLNAAATHRVGVNSILYNVAISSCERSTQWEHAPWEILANFWFGAERALNIFEWFHLFLYRMNTNNKFNLRLLRCFSTSSNVDRHNTILESTMCSILFPCAEKSVTQALHAFQQLENSTASDAPESWDRWEIIEEGAPIGWKTRENSQKKTQVSSWYKIVVSDKNWLYFSGDNTWRCS